MCVLLSAPPPFRATRRCPRRAAAEAFSAESYFILLLHIFALYVANINRILL